MNGGYVISTYKNESSGGRLLCSVTSQYDYIFRHRSIVLLICKYERQYVSVVDSMYLNDCVFNQSIIQQRNISSQAIAPGPGLDQVVIICLPHTVHSSHIACPLTHSSDKASTVRNIAPPMLINQSVSQSVDKGYKNMR